MNDINNLEKKINSELTTKIKKSKIKHSQLYLSIDQEDLINVVLFLKTNIIQEKHLKIQENPKALYVFIL